MDSAAPDPRPALRARPRPRRLPAGVAEGSARPGLRQPESSRGLAATRSPSSGAPRGPRPSPTPRPACSSRKRAGWRNPKHAHDWPGSLVRFVSPRFGERPVSEIKQCRRARRARPHLAREAGDRPPGAPAHRGRDAVGGGHGVPGRQPVRPRRRDARAPTRCRSAHASPAACRGWLGRGDGPGVAGDHGVQARVRVPGADRGPVPARCGWRGGEEIDLNADLWTTFPPSA